MSTEAHPPENDNDLSSAEPTAEEFARPCSEFENRFAEQYLVDLCAKEAARRAGSKANENTLKGFGWELMQRPRVQRRIEELFAERSKRTGITVDAVLQRFWAKATADPRELSEVHLTCCRYCHGKNFDYQRTKAELARDRAKWEKTQVKSSPETFDEQGGDGFNARKDPHEACPECFGEGVARVIVHDTRKLSPAALSIYAGVKVTKNGDIEVKMHSQDEALQFVARHLRMFDADGPAGGAKDPAENARHVRAALREIVDVDGIRDVA